MTATEPPPLTWTIGSRGLLGRAVARNTSGSVPELDRLVVPWSDPGAAVAVLSSAAVVLLGQRRPWRIVWCAGAGVIGTTGAQLEAEVRILTRFLAQLELHLSDRTADGCVFLASSAGGIYAGASEPPFTETTVPRPISPYGQAKLNTEQVASDFAQRTQTPLLIGRIANLYGPGQDLTKPQGLISQLCRAHLTRRPLSIYVPLDAGRDYLYVDDAARLVSAGLDWVSEQRGVQLKIMASQRSTTVAAILAELRRVSKRRPEVILGRSPLAKYSARDLRFRSVVCTRLDASVRTTLATGIAATLASRSLELRLGRLTSG